MADLINIIKQRRSVRKFKDRAVDRRLIEHLIQIATNAPSACNIQGWRFIIIDNQKIKNKLYELGGSIVIPKAPLGILVLYDSRTPNREYSDHIQSAAAAIQNLLLLASNSNLGACWICHLPLKKTLQKIFNIPKVFSPIAYIIMGHPLEKSSDMPRKYNIEQLISYNSFGKNLKIEKINQFEIYFKKILSKMYYLTPNFIKKLFLNKLIDKNFVKKFKN